MKLDGKNVLVTGGAGFIGSHLVDALLEKDCNIIVIDDLSNGKEKNLDNAFKKGIKFINGSVENYELIEKLLNDVSIIFHQAALNLVLSTKNPLKDMSVNIKGTLNILEAARKLGNTDVIVNASTGSVYGEPLYQPQDEDHPLKPCSPYGVSKLAAELYANLWNKLYDLKTVSLRYYNIYGPRKNYNEEHGCVVSIFVKRALENKPLIINGDGLQERHFTYVSDVVRANIIAAESPSVYGDSYNIGNKDKITIKELAILVKKLCQSKSEFIFQKPRLGDIKFMSPNLKKSEKKLGFTSSVKINKGVILLNEWMKKELRIN